MKAEGSTTEPFARPHFRGGGKVRGEHGNNDDNSNNNSNVF